MNLEFKSEETDFFKAIGITPDDELVFMQFKEMYYVELKQKFQSKKIEAKLNDFQLKKFALELSSHSKMLRTGMEWFKEHKRKDQLTVLLLGDIFFRLALGNKTYASPKIKKLDKGLVS